MATQTDHLNLDLREASDIFNPLSTNSNFETLDNVIYEIQQKGGVPTYTTTASANLLKLSANPTPNETVFKFVAAGDANTWSYQETVNNIVDLSGSQKTVKAGEMYVAWVNAANAMVVIAWPDVVNAQTFDGKGPAEWATTAQLQAVNQTAANATQTAQAAATVANNALAAAQAAISPDVKSIKFSSDLAGFGVTAFYSNTGVQFSGVYLVNTGDTNKIRTFKTITAGSGNTLYCVASIEGNPFQLAENDLSNNTNPLGIPILAFSTNASTAPQVFRYAFILYDTVTNKTYLSSPSGLTYSDTAKFWFCSGVLFNKSCRTWPGV